MSAYPGDDAVQVWVSSSPYRFLVYPIGGARDRSAVATWRGRATHLRTVGWGLAVLYKPRVGGGIGYAGPLTRSQGAADGYDAVAQWRWERMPAGGVCYLDTTPLSTDDSPTARAAGWLDYYKGWVGAVIDSGMVQPGTCCAATHAPMLADALHAVYRERHRTPRRPSFWMAAVRSISGTADSPAASMLGEGAAALWRTEIWQPAGGVLHQSYGGIHLAVSSCWATTTDPSFDASVIEPASLATMLRPGVAESVSAVLSAAVPSPVVSDARVLMEACLAALGLARLGGDTPFPHGIGDVEIQLTERDGAVQASIRVTAREPRPE